MINRATATTPDNDVIGTKRTTHVNMQAARAAGQEGAGEEAKYQSTNKVPAICEEECEILQTWEGGEPGVDPVVMAAARWQRGTGEWAIEAMGGLGNGQAVSVREGRAWEGPELVFVWVNTSMLFGDSVYNIVFFIHLVTIFEDAPLLFVYL